MVILKNINYQFILIFRDVNLVLTFFFVFFRFLGVNFFFHTGVKKIHT
jgi:hypothetical protein